MLYEKKNDGISVGSFSAFFIASSPHHLAMTPTHKYNGIKRQEDDIFSCPGRIAIRVA